MRVGFLGALILAVSLSGCSFFGGIGTVRIPDVSVPKMSEVVDVMTRGGIETFEKTTPAGLNPTQDQSVRQSVRRIFPGSWDVVLKGLDTGRTVDGRLVTCGIYNASSAKSGNKRSGIFRAETDPATNQTVVREAAHSGSNKLAAFSNCQALGLF
ncbi:hypothetical protein [Fulvimarina sp. MAC8]|uniref:hypothetical protein n=1 Tax=Fulvimarina sp. MAC8 TaxID=3162874 RepID=UPI0032EB90F1